MFRLIPALALCGCTFVTDFDRAYPIPSVDDPDMLVAAPDGEVSVGDLGPQADARRIDAGEHDRLEHCRGWCEEYTPCIAAACGQGVTGPEVEIGIGFCLDQCIEGVYAEPADRYEPTPACNLQTATDRRRRETCAQQLWIDCDFLCASPGGAVLQACYGVDPACTAKCEGLSDEELRCVGYAISAIPDDEREDIVLLCDTVKPCLTWPQD